MKRSLIMRSLSGPSKPKFKLIEEGCFNGDDSLPEELILSIEVPLMVKHSHLDSLSNS